MGRLSAQGRRLCQARAATFRRTRLRGRRRKGLTGRYRGFAPVDPAVCKAPGSLAPEFETPHMRYTLRQIEYFIATAETGSITLASERVNISQPSISTAIAHLEEELGTQLFVRRHAQGLSLTSAGRVLLVEAKRLIEQAENVYSVASEVGERVRGQLSLGCLVTLAPMVMPELSHSFTSTYAETRIAHMVADHEQLLDRLLRAELDVAITYDLLIPDEFEFLPLASLPPHVVVSEAGPLARHSAVSLQELAREPLILLDLPVSPENFLSNFIKEGLEPNIASRSTDQDERQRIDRLRRFCCIFVCL